MQFHVNTEASKAAVARHASSLARAGFGSTLTRSLRWIGFWSRGREEAVRVAAFVLRCAGAGTVAYLAGSRIGLPHAIWVTMSALIVSQERLEETRLFLVGRILGTLIGICVAIAVHMLAFRFSADMAAQIAVAVAICAFVARGRPALRVCMWTGPIVLLTVEPSVPIATIALYRGGEVILGALIGGSFHWLADVAVNALPCAMRRSVKSRSASGPAPHQAEHTPR